MHLFRFNTRFPFSRHHSSIVSPRRRQLHVIPHVYVPVSTSRPVNSFFITAITLSLLHCLQLLDLFFSTFPVFYCIFISLKLFCRFSCTLVLFTFIIASHFYATFPRNAPFPFHTRFHFHGIILPSFRFVVVNFTSFLTFMFLSPPHRLSTAF